MVGFGNCQLPYSNYCLKDMFPLPLFLWSNQYFLFPRFRCKKLFEDAWFTMHILQWEMIKIWNLGGKNFILQAKLRFKQTKKIFKVSVYNFCIFSISYSIKIYILFQDISIFLVALVISFSTIFSRKKNESHKSGYKLQITRK